MKAFLQLLAPITLFVFFGPISYAAPSPAFEGRKLYLSHCMICHGFDGRGNGPLAKKLSIEPEDLIDYVPGHSDNYLQRIIAGDDRDAILKRSGHGDIGKDMPKWSTVFTPRQVMALVAYLRYLSTAKHTLPGDPELGYSLYQQYCAICHGKDGDAGGVLTKLIGISPIDHTNPQKTDSLDNNSLAKSILDGEGDYMPGWRGILDNNEVNALVSYIRLLYQIWGKLEYGGMVIVINSPTLETDKKSTQALLKDTSCGSKVNLSGKGRSQAVKLGKLFKSRGVPVQTVLSSPDCLATETATTAFGKAESVDYLMSSTKLTDEQTESHLSTLENRIGSYSGKGNLVIMTHQANIDALSFQRVGSDYFLVLMPLGGNEYDEIGAYKLNN
ncbi:MAG: c-type cytochrome [Candidatus Thiodiazotropha sp.]